MRKPYKFADFITPRNIGAIDWHKLKSIHASRTCERCGRSVYCRRIAPLSYVLCGHCHDVFWAFLAAHRARTEGNN